MVDADEKRTYKRPKSRKNKCDNVDGGGLLEKVQSYLPPSRPECSSPLDRFCELLIEWDLRVPLNSILNVPPIPLSFASYSSYVKTWEPFLIREVQANLLSSLPKTPTCGSCQLRPMDLEDTKNKLLKLQCSLSSSDKTSSMQVVLISILPQQRLQNMVTTRDFHEGDKAIIGVITGQYRQQVEVMVRREKYFEIIRNSCTPQPLCYTEIGGVTSHFREFLALHEAHRTPILPAVLRPALSLADGGAACPSTPPHCTPKGAFARAEVALGEVDTEEEDLLASIRDAKWEMPGVGVAFNAFMHKKFNSSQLEAIRSAVETKKGFCLIQGPPGTGKTSTILGLLNSLHIRDYNFYFETILKHTLGRDGLRCREKGQDPVPWVALINSLVSASTRPHLLVVAPSNVAVDNIIQRIADKGFKDSSGSTYFPNILRVGSGTTKGTDQSARAVSLEESVESMLREDEDSCSRLDRELAAAVKEAVSGIVQFQTILLNMKICWESHPLGPGWELRMILETGQPYWVDHTHRTTSATPPPPPAEGVASDYSTLDTLPEYKYYTHSIVQKLEELRILHLRKVRVRVVNEFCRSKSGKGGGGSSSSLLRHSLETSFIDEADIVFTTLNSSGHPCLEGSVFPVVIIDEAGQCVEPSSLIPLRLGCVQCVMVGDQKQLSATIFSKSSGGKFYDRSLFERIDQAREDQGIPGSLMLDTQYRMLPDISRFPSSKFYHGMLKDGDNVKTPGYGPQFLGAPQDASHLGEMGPLQPFIFFDLQSSKDALSSSAQSRSNVEEARLCLQLVELLISEAARNNEPVGSIGIITPYQEQLRDLTRMFENASLIVPRGGRRPADGVGVDPGVGDGGGSADDLYAGLFGASTGSRQFQDIELNTVDAFQGREKDIIVISCVRSNDIGSIGFLSDLRRMNVALTRARFGLYVIGNAETLQSNKDWGEFIEYARVHHSLVSIRSSDVDIYHLLRDGYEKEVQASEDNNIPGQKRPSGSTLGLAPPARKLVRITSDSTEEGEIQEDEVSC